MAAIRCKIAEVAKKVIKLPSLSGCIFSILFFLMVRTSKKTERSALKKIIADEIVG